MQSSIKMSDDESSVLSSSLDSFSAESSNQSGSGQSSNKDEEGVSRDEIKRVQGLAQAETRRIKLWRLIVILTLLVAGATVSTFTYIFLSSE